MPNHNDRNKWTTSFVVQNMLWTKIMPGQLKYTMCLKNVPCRFSFELLCKTIEFQ